MAKRQQQPIAGAAIMLGVSGLLTAAYFGNDLYSPSLFLLKAGLQPLMLLALLSFFVYSVISRTKMIFITTLAVTILSSLILLPKFEHVSDENYHSADPSLVVATFNTMTRTENIDDIVAFADSKSPSLLCLQEVSKPHRQALLKHLTNRYKYHVENDNNQLTLSTYPLTLSKDYGHMLVSTVSHPKWGDIDVINAHMPRPYLSQDIDKSWQRLFDRLSGQSIAILCGDLNATPNNSIYDLLSYRFSLEDSLTRGYGFTYPNAQRRSSLFGPIIRIDYIFTRGLTARKTQTMNVSNLSDHRAILTQLTHNPVSENVPK